MDFGDCVAPLKFLQLDFLFYYYYFIDLEERLIMEKCHLAFQWIFMTVLNWYNTGNLLKLCTVTYLRIVFFFCFVLFFPFLSFQYLRSVISIYEQLTYHSLNLSWSRWRFNSKWRYWWWKQDSYLCLFKPWCIRYYTINQLLTLLEYWSHCLPHLIAFVQ